MPQWDVPPERSVAERREAAKTVHPGVFERSEKMAGWTGLEPATSDVTGERNRAAHQRFAELRQRVRATRPDTGRHGKTPSDGPK